jgi:hypothetical protein
VVVNVGARKIIYSDFPKDIDLKGRNNREVLPALGNRK